MKLQILVPINKNLQLSMILVMENISLSIIKLEILLKIHLVKVKKLDGKKKKLLIKLYFYQHMVEIVQKFCNKYVRKL